MMDIEKGANPGESVAVMLSPTAQASSPVNQPPSDVPALPKWRLVFITLRYVATLDTTFNS
jgi:hypothetical protein